MISPSPFALSLLLASPVALASSDWPQSRHDAQNTAAVELDAPRSGKPHAWSFDGSGRVWGYQPGMTTWSSPALAEVAGRALVVAGSYDRNLYCLDAASGEVQWKFTTGGPIDATPAIWRDGDRTWLYATSSDRLVYALDAALGRQEWVHSIEQYRPTLGGARVSAPVVGAVKAQPAIFAGHWVHDSSLANSLQRGGLTALGARDGRLLWTTQLGDNQMTAPIFAFVRGRGTLFVGSSNGALYAVDADEGRVVWTTTELDAVRAPPTFVELPTGALVVSASKYGAVRGLDAATGAQRWQLKTGDRVTGSPAIANVSGRPIVLVGSYDRTLYALDARDGSMVWRYQARGGIYSSPAIAAAKPALALVSAWDHALHAVELESGAGLFTSFTGRPLWEVAGLDESNWSSPAVARVNGAWMVYAGSYDGWLRALPLEASDRRAPAIRSNLAFWLSFPASLIPLAAIALALTRRHRRSMSLK